MAKLYGELDDAKKVILGSFSNPYFDNEVLYRAVSVSDVREIKQYGYTTIQIKYNNGNDERVSTSVRVLAKDSTVAAFAFKEAGYKVYSMEYDIKNGRGASYDIEIGKKSSKNAASFEIKKLYEF